MRLRTRLIGLAARPLAAIADRIDARIARAREARRGPAWKRPQKPPSKLIVDLERLRRPLTPLDP